MSLPTCPACDGATVFLGNESGTGKSWFACRACMPNQVFSRRLAEQPRFDFADTSQRKTEPDNESAVVERA
jgi:hypothetical protein